MTVERETAQGMFERQERERLSFLRSQARRLNRVGFAWVIPEDFAERHNYNNKGLVIKDNSRNEAYSQRISKVLKPDGDLVLVNISGGEFPIHGLLDSAETLFIEVEDSVTGILTNLQRARSVGSSS